MSNLERENNFVADEWGKSLFRNRECDCGSGEERWSEFDGQGIFLTYVCPSCEKQKLKRYRPEILGPYTQADVDERIEPEE